MVRNFAFQEAASKPEVERVAPGIIMRPVVRGQESKGIQMPVTVTRLEVD